MTPTRPEHPPRTPLREVLDWLGPEARAVTEPSGEVTGVTLSSRSVVPGDLYVAPQGGTAHGARYAAAAVDAGARAVLTDEAGAEICREAGVAVPVLVVPTPRTVVGALAARVYGNPAAHLRLVGVTGTQGKTTTTRLAEAALQASGTRAAVIGTVGTRIDGVDVRSALTTPEAPDLHALFAVMRERGVEACAMEVSSHALVMGRVDGVVFDVAAFTNLGRDHLDFHESVEDYFSAKAGLFTAARTRLAVVNIDDAHGRRLVEEAEVPVRTFSTQGADADWQALDVAPEGTGSSFTVRHGGEEHRTSVTLPGAFNVSNALCALAVLVEAGYALPTLAAALASVPGVPGRLEPVDVGQPFLAVVDYAHKPDAVEAALSTLRARSDGRVLVVLGAGGDRDTGKRPVMGEIAARLADVLVVTDDNPRSEDPATIRAEVLAGATRGAAEVHDVGDRAAAIRLAVSLARPGDVVVVAGKGHETGQEVAGSIHPFDDRVELRAAILEHLGVVPVIPMTLADLASVVGGEVHDDPDGVTVTGPAFFDTRTPETGGLFAAFVGEHVDGHAYAAAAVEAGAAAVLGSRPTGVPTVVVADPQTALGRLATHVLGRLPDLRVLAVTGSQGKTSTKDLLAAVLADAAPTVATAGSFNNELGLPVTVLRSDRATRFLLLEMGARGIGHLRTLCAIARPDVSLVLNVGKAHLGEFGTQDDIATAKGELVEALTDEGTAVLNADDPRVAAMAARTTARVVTFGTDPTADVRLGEVSLDGDGRPRFTLGLGGDTVEVALRLVGRHQAMNAAAAVAAATAVGIPLADACASLALVETLSRWRMEVHRREDGVTVVNDAYNANPGSMEAALDALVALGGTARRTVAVLGEMRELGASATQEHEGVGRLAVRLGVHRVVAVGEAARGVHTGALEAGATEEEAVLVGDNDAAVHWLEDHLRPGDVVLLKASRGAQLDRVADALLTPEGADR